MDEPEASGTARAPIPAVIYAAKSTEDKHGSIASQLADCRKMAAENGWSVVGEYQDEGFSAYSRSRGPGLAEAREHAARAAAESGITATLVTQHSDRLSRGAGDKPGAPDALIEIWHAERRRDVHLRSVQDDFDLRSSASVANMGERNHADSKRKAAATAAGKRRAAERGESTGAVPDGYKITKVADGTIVSRSVEQDPERKHVYRLIWDLAIDGMTVRSIVRELAKARCMTAPRKATPRPFDAVRVDKVLNCAFYAGLVVSRGEIVAAGKWVAYVEPDDWHRLQAERKARTRHRSEPVGRPAGGLLARLARCECGAAMVQQRGGPRKDGSRRRVYTCRVHMHGAGACEAKPFDAELVERMILEGLDQLLGDGGEWATALLVGRGAEHARLEAMGVDAAREAEEADGSIERLSRRYERALTAGDHAEIDLAKRAWATQRQTAERAAVRQRAAEDALAEAVGEPMEDADAMLALVLRAVAGDMAAAEADIAALNNVLRRYFDRFELGCATGGGVRVVPVFSYDRALELVRQRFIERCHRIARTPAPFGDGWGFLERVAASADEISGSTPDAGQPDKQRPSHPAHNTRPGSSPSTAGGGPRRNRTGVPRRPARARSLSDRGRLR
jgi:DNA invertase Pin-like site-specific DNA recombinase